MSLNTPARKMVAGILLLGLLVAWFHTGPAPAQPTAVTPAQLGDVSLCDAWHGDPSNAGLTAELQRRHLLNPEEMHAARAGKLFVGMRATAVVCTLGGSFQSSEFTSTHGSVTTWIYARENARPIIIHLDNGMRVDAFQR